MASNNFRFFIDSSHYGQEHYGGSRDDDKGRAKATKGRKYIYIKKRKKGHDTVCFYLFYWNLI